MAIKIVAFVVDQHQHVVDKELEGKVLEAREAMCDIVNGDDGMIMKWWNPMLDAVGITDEDIRMTTDDVAYLAVSNAIWTMQLRKLGVKNVTIVDEVFQFSTRYADDDVDNMDGIVTIKVAVES